MLMLPSQPPPPAYRSLLFHTVGRCTSKLSVPCRMPVTLQYSAAPAAAGTSVASLSAAPASEAPAKIEHFSCAVATGVGGGVCVGAGVGNSTGQLPAPSPPPPQAVSRMGMLSSA